MSSKKRVAGIALLCLTLAIAGCRARSNDAYTPTLRLATYEWPGSYWIDVALKKGWFEAAGLKVERIDVDRRYFAAQDDVAGGKLDAMSFSHFDLVRHVAVGHDLVGILATDYSDGAEALIAKTQFHRLRDLKGRRVALHRGTYLEYLLSIAAERDGIALEDMTLIDRTSDMAVEDFKSGRVDAVFGWEPYVGYALKAGGVSLFSTADFPGLTYSIMTVRREFLETNKAQLAALIRVWRRSERFVRENPDEAAAIAANAFGEPYDDVRGLMHTVRELDLADNFRAFSYAAGFESLHGSWRRMNDFMLDQGLVTSRVDSPAHLDANFIRMLD
jgi:NitT/TauT family transport system substrate-binding protein